MKWNVYEYLLTIYFLIIPQILLTYFLTSPRTAVSLILSLPPPLPHSLFSHTHISLFQVKLMISLLSFVFTNYFYLI